MEVPISYFYETVKVLNNLIWNIVYYKNKLFLIFLKAILIKKNYSSVGRKLTQNKLHMLKHVIHFNKFPFP